MTALFYFKRFFVGVNVFNADPIRVLATCVFLASKVRLYRTRLARSSAGRVGDGACPVWNPGQHARTCAPALLAGRARRLTSHKCTSLSLSSRPCAGVAV